MSVERTETTEADLRRATSDLYYALFHAVCEALVEELWTEDFDDSYKKTVQAMYRLPDHGHIEKRCKDVKATSFDDAVKHFASQIIVMKNKRTLADYDAFEQFKRSAVKSDIESVETRLEAFMKVPADERRRFAYFLVSIKGRQA